MLGLGPTEIVIIFFLVLLLFGGKKLPALGGAIGKSLKNFKVGLKEGVQNKKINDED
jgi:sec-independent protein translocase protein TatA